MFRRFPVGHRLDLCPTQLLVHFRRPILASILSARDALLVPSRARGVFLATVPEPLYFRTLPHLLNMLVPAATFTDERRPISAAVQKTAAAPAPCSLSSTATDSWNTGYQP